MTDSIAHIDATARQAVAEFPDPFRTHAQSVVLQVRDWPEDWMLEDLQIDRREELTGLYDGVPLTEKTPSDPQTFPDTVWLFREPILLEWRARGNVSLEELVTHVVVHEFAHHFGWSDADIAHIDRWWE